MNAFVRDTGERAVRTVAQTAVALWGTAQVNIVDLDWQEIGGVSLAAGFLSILTSIAGGKWGSNQGTPAGFVALDKPKE